ncbi:Membrane-bound lytic murein transglycosylase D precursor [Indibacter alkaliphilus LW1]|uniref:Membrane-bound lytic murein transglycosylase D n=1 Tax=Indibacter alkaliphilus (strain CCUG 57479 / KCTC 22604 / LW1) TaxID=1189612 RepID=S2D9Y0_INDAL|nr:LysM peptidoglycan-binding domain-containing protein [Indibacter alkaliphilus]EOZ95714.1 Membrane-bound lytic murein transglycosylase D precursor [Indibacter alkaliphilus LW1]
MKKLLILSFVLFSFSSVYAYDHVPMDSVGVEKVGDKTFIIHEVSQGETLFGISRRYEVAVNDILQNNAQLQDGLKMGQRVRIPYVAKEALPEGASLHKVAPGETLFAVSRKYGVSVSEVMEWNKLKGNDLSVGQALIIKKPNVAEANTAPAAAPPAQTVSPANPPAQVAAPANEKTETATVIEEAKVAAKPLAEASKQEPKEVFVKETEMAKPTPASGAASPNTSKALPGDWITHTVEQGETLFSIAKRYEARIDDIISWNALSSNNLSTGQKLKVGREKVEASTVPIVVNNEKKEAKLVTNESSEESTAYKNVKETGLAEVIEGTGNHKKYLVLHRDAPVGTIMRVRNEENDQTIFARVVGKLPDTGDNNRLVIKLSKAAYDQLRAVNTRFPVEISY